MFRLKEYQSSLPIHLLTFLIQLQMLLCNPKVCNVLVGIDEPLYNHHQQNLSQLTELVEDHFDGVNSIFRNNETGVFRDSLADISFKVGRIQVMFGSCDSFKYENCTENRDKYLQIFDQYDFKQFCLAYMFTYL